VARDRKRTRRSRRPNRQPGASAPPPAAAGLGLPDEPVGLSEDAAVDGQPIEPPGNGEPAGSSVFPQLGAFAEEPVNVAFGEPELPYEQPARARAEHGNRVFNFLRGCWAELQRVQWPDRRQVAQATGVVLGFVVIAGIFLGVADQISQQIVNAIL
jgi:preprotein translocase SecE subunit